GEEEVPREIIESYEKICGGLIKGFEQLGLKAEHKPVNDVLANEKKISGSAQTRRWGSVLQHGTILIDPDIRKMFELLKVSPEKISDKFITSVYQRVTSLNRELGDTPSFDDVREAMARGFEEVFEIELNEGKLSPGEKELAGELRKKYASRDWVGKR
ncbi:riboflavin biosynthesis protein RibF, partial [candidate division MSBL1 archaeon SCGC-AAA833F18]